MRAALIVTVLSCAARVAAAEPGPAWEVLVLAPSPWTCHARAVRDTRGGETRILDGIVRLEREAIERAAVQAHCVSPGGEFDATVGARVRGAKQVVADLRDLGLVTIRVTNRASSSAMGGAPVLVGTDGPRSLQQIATATTPTYLASSGTYTLVWAEHGRARADDADAMAVYCQRAVHIEPGRTTTMRCDVTPGEVAFELLGATGQLDVVAPPPPSGVDHVWGFGRIRSVRSGQSRPVYSGRWRGLVRLDEAVGCEVVDLHVRPGARVDVQRKLQVGRLDVRVEPAELLYVAYADDVRCGAVVRGAPTAALAGLRTVHAVGCRDDGSALELTQRVRVRAGRKADVRMKFERSARLEVSATCEGTPCESDLGFAQGPPRTRCRSFPGVLGLPPAGQDSEDEGGTVWAQVPPEGRTLYVAPGARQLVASIEDVESPTLSVDLRASACRKVRIQDTPDGPRLMLAKCRR